MSIKLKKLTHLSQQLLSVLCLFFKNLMYFEFLDLTQIETEPPPRLFFLLNASQTRSLANYYFLLQSLFDLLPFPSIT